MNEMKKMKKMKTLAAEKMKKKKQLIVEKKTRKQVAALWEELLKSSSQNTWQALLQGAFDSAPPRQL